MQYTHAVRPSRLAVVVQAVQQHLAACIADSQVARVGREGEGVDVVQGGAGGGPVGEDGEGGGVQQPHGVLLETGGERQHLWGAVVAAVG